MNARDELAQIVHSKRVTGKAGPESNAFDFIIADAILAAGWMAPATDDRLHYTPESWDYAYRAGRASTISNPVAAPNLDTEGTDDKLEAIRQIAGEGETQSIGDKWYTADESRIVRIRKLLVTIPNPQQKPLPPYEVIP